MAELILFHHAQGLTDGVRAFAGELRAAGHEVHVPDLYDGRTFAGLADGIAHAEQVGFDTIVERGRLAADGLPDDIVYAGDADELSLPPNEDLEAARRLDETVEEAELFVYPGDRHLFADRSLPDYDEGAAALLRERVLRFLDDLG